MTYYLEEYEYADVFLGEIWICRVKGGEVIPNFDEEDVTIQIKNELGEEPKDENY